MCKSICIEKYFWENGKIKREDFLTEDNLLIVKDYTSESTFWQETSYDADYEKHGLHFLYFLNGKVKLEEEFEHGEIIYQKTYNQFGLQLTLDTYEDGTIKKRIIMMVGIVDF